MSESDDDAAFASADEGDSTVSDVQAAEKEKLPASNPVASQAKGKNKKQKQKKKTASKGKPGTDKSKETNVQQNTEKERPDQAPSGSISNEEKDTNIVEKDTESEVHVKDLPQKSCDEQKLESDCNTDITDTSDIKKENVETEKPTKPQKEKEEKGGWSWGGWGSSFVAAASHSVSTFTNQLEEGLNTIVDAMENSLGALSPEELAKMKAEAKKCEPTQEEIERDEKSEGGVEKMDEDLASRIKEPEEKEEEESIEKGKDKENDDGGWFSSWGMSSLSSVVQNTTNVSKNLMTGGLDVLESIGKKTFEVIKDHDPGLRKTREVLFDWGEKPNLSAVLREAKEEAEEKMELEREAAEMRKAHFGSLFDDYQGLAHLEALEILSNRCEKKVHSLLGSMPIETLSEVKADLVQIKQEFERNEDQELEDVEDHDFGTLLREKVSKLQIGVAPEKLCECQEKIRKTLNESKEKVEKGDIEAREINDYIGFIDEENHNSLKTNASLGQEIHQHAIQCLAQFTAKSVEVFHKTGEMILLHANSEVTNKARAKILSSVTDVLCTEVGILSSKYSACLNQVNEKEEDKSSINTLVTNLYLEAGNSATYVQDAFQLMLPCVQEAALQKAITDSK